MNFVVFDTEDDSRELMEAGKSGFDKETTQIAAIKSNGKRIHFEGKKCVTRFLAWTLKQDEKEFWAFNSQYDLGNLFGDVIDVMDVVLVGGRMISARWKGKIFLDVGNIFQGQSVKTLGEMFGLKKLDGADKSKLFRNKAYVFRDCEIPMKALKFAYRFAAKRGVDLTRTVGGLAFKIWRGDGGQNFHDSLELSREALYGGRVELFSVGGQGNIMYYDVNSLYPYAMTKPFPDAMLPMRDLEGFGVARVRVSVPRLNIAPLPYRSDEGKIYFPTGTFEGVWTIAEIQAAMERGVKVLKLFEVWGSKTADYYYRDYVLKYHKLKNAAKTKPEKQFYKYLLNTLYGRLGLTGVVTRSVRLTEEVMSKTDRIPYGTKVLASYQMPLPDFVNWSHAAHITSYGRIILLEYLDKIGAENLIYCDTDSAFFFWKPGKKLPFKVGANLGDMEKEGEANECYTYAPKQYQFGKEFKAKGVRRHLAEEFIRNGHTEYDLPFKFREAVQFFDRGNAKKLSVWRRIQKEIRTTYDKKRKYKGMYFPIDVRKIK